jgi:aerobic-type carbon monoxide dehydrogenase small subunit (CoxS/CutS family)
MGSMIEFRVNGEAREFSGDPERSLLSVLRDDFDLTGAKYGCGEAQCGACTVLIDGKAVRSCVTPVGLCQGKQVTSIEGLELDGRLHPVQQAFLDHDAMQCGFCTPGMILSAVGLFGRNPNPNADEIGRALNGNVCRCGTYARIVQAVLAAASGRGAST